MYVVYCIKNKVTGRIYIGSTCNLNRRKSEHLKDLRHNKHYSLPMQEDYNKYGEQSFTISVIEECTKETQYEREQYYLDLYKPYENGYNKSVKAAYADYKDSYFHKSHYGKDNQFYGKHHTKELKEMMSKRRKGIKTKPHTEATKKLISEKAMGELNHNAKRVYQYSLTGEFIAEYGSAADAARALNMKSESSINNVCKTNDSNPKEYRIAYGYIWKYERW